MRETVIISDGEKDLVIGVAYFFQDEEIIDLKKDEVTQLYKHTAIKEVALRISDPLNQIDKVRRGLSILGQMVRDMHGDEIGLILITEIKTQVNLASR